MLASLLVAASVGQVADSPPDLSLLPDRLSDAYVTTNNPELPTGTRALRFSTGSYNGGPGRLECRGAEVVGNQQRVLQRVWRTDGTWYDRTAGWFIYHQGHGHIHFEDWTIFRLRQMTPGGGVGAIVGTGTKTSFCIIEISPVDPSRPGHSTPPGYNSCGQVQGLRPGWADVYGSTLTGQYINLTGVPDGNYWLEGVIDPNFQLLEANEFNNTTRVPVAIGNPPNAQPDPYEPNNSIAEVDSKTEGGANSPNLGLITSTHRITNLSATDAADWFKFRISRPGDGAYVLMESPWLRQGNLDLEIYNSQGSMVKRAAQTYNYEYISLKGLAGGTYYAKVVRSPTTNNPLYFLTIALTPAAINGSDINEPLGPTFVEHAYEFTPVRWAKTGLANGRVSLLKSRTRNVDAAEEIDGYKDLPMEHGFANVNTVQFGLGRHYLMARTSNGTSFDDKWAPGPLWVYEKGDTNFDGRVSMREVNDLVRVLARRRELPLGWAQICDMDRDGDVDRDDVREMRHAARHGGGGGHGH
jgi:hypothetical protein